MRLDLYLQEKANMAAENRVLKLIVVVIGLTVVGNSYLLMQALDRQTVVLVPPVIDRRITIARNTVSDDYLRIFGRYIASLALNYTPATARAQFEELLGLYDATAYAKAQQTFYQLAESIEQTKITNVYHVQEITVDTAEQTLVIQGMTTRHVEDLVVETVPEWYRVGYVIKEGRFWIRYIEQVDRDNLRRRSRS